MPEPDLKVTLSLLDMVKKSKQDERQKEGRKKVKGLWFLSKTWFDADRSASRCFEPWSTIGNKEDRRERVVSIAKEKRNKDNRKEIGRQEIERRRRNKSQKCSPKVF